MTESCRLEQVLMEDLNSFWAESSGSSSSESQLTQPSGSEESEHVKVYLRVRPFTAAEAQSGESQDCVSVEPPDKVLLRPPGASQTARLGADKWAKPSLHSAQRFRFSQVYGPDSTQRDLFQGTLTDLLQNVLRGGNSLLFTYGVTNAGKTFTFLGPAGDAGILPRSLDAIFGSLQGKVLSGASVKPQRCREFVRLSEEQRAREAAFKSDLLRRFNESHKAAGGLHSLQGSRPLREEEHPSLRAEADSKFSVWVSFCEIYKENIHDLLEAAPAGAARRTALRLSQDVQGDAFVQDLRWVQVDSADEAYRVMKLGKKNQSFSSTGINRLSSRSHSIFSVRIVTVKSARAVAVSELCLCDLAGSERCAKTLNRGERLKEAGNINTSLLILGKCINALRRNRHAKLLQHVPFRESKLTHYLQAFFRGRGQVRMMVNVSPCAATYDETLQVLKFSALAQKVVLLPSRAALVPPHKPRPGKTLRGSVIGWESSLEDVQEDDDADDEEEKMSTEDTTYESEEEEGDDESVISQMTPQQAALLRRLQMALKRERADGMLAETRIREEVSRDFGRIFADMQNGFTERLARETRLLEERADKRLEIFKKMTDKMAACREAHGEEALNGEERATPEDAVGALEKETDEALQEGSASGEEGHAALRDPWQRQTEAPAAPEEEDAAARQDAGKRSGGGEEQVGSLLHEVRGITAALEGSQQQVADEAQQAAEEQRREQREVSGKWPGEAGRRLRDREAACRRLRRETQLQEAGATRCAAEQDLGALISELRAQVASLKAKEAETPKLLKDGQVQTERPPAKASQDDDGVPHECRRRELPAVAHEAIRQKDAELEKMALRIDRLKELAKQDSDKVRSLSADLQRKEEDSADLREKMADYKKQIQQVHVDISSMKEEERLLRQKLSDVDKVRKRLQSDLANRERTIQQLKAVKLEAKRRLADDMRSTLEEQEETQEQMERLLEHKVRLIQELHHEVDKMKETLRQRDSGRCAGSRDLQLAKEDAVSAHESLKLFEEKQLTERHKWQADKMALIGQLKEAEDKRNQEMKKFAEDRERYLARQAELEAELRAKEQRMVSWRQERDALVAALEVQLHKLLASQADKDKIIRRLGERSPAEAGGGAAATESHTASLKEDGEDGGVEHADAQGSSGCPSGCPSVLESSEISTENGRASRFPLPEMEISFSPLRPDRMALRRRGDPSAVTVKITRSARKRKSADVDKCHIFSCRKRPTHRPKQDEVEAENGRNANVTATASQHQEERPRPSASPRSLRSRKGATLRKIGDFLQSSPTLIGSKAKKMMGLASASSPSPSSNGLRSKKSKRKLFSANISSPMDVPPHPMLTGGLGTDDKQSDHLIIKRRLRSRIGK